MVAVGLEELGIEEFVQGKFFDGEIYLDSKKKCYQDLGFKRIGFFNAIGSVLGKKGRDMISEAKSKGIGGNLKGDGFQNGGTIIVGEGGKLLLNFVQEGPADHVSPEDVLKTLNITGSPPADSGGAGTLVCDEEACQMKK